MVQDSVNVLLVEDDLVYARVSSQAIAAAAPECLVVHVPALGPALDRLASARFDVVILDLGLPDSDGLATLDTLVRHSPLVPVVVAALPADEALSRAALRQGAQDWIVKGNTTPGQLARALRQAIARNSVMPGAAAPAAVAALAAENARLRREARELFDADLTGNFVAAVDGTLTDCNPAFARMLGYANGAEANAGGALAIFGGDVNWRSFAGSVARDRRVRQHEMALRGREGGPVHVLVSATGFFDESGQLTTIRGQLYDLTAHKQLEEQLSQSQKMEAVGRLAGGIAHDFNNLLMVIGGQTGRLLDKLPENEPLRKNAEAIASAADRAAGLTQQLLAFSRRQVLSPQVLSLNAVVRNVYGMLERVIGEDINCVMSLSEGIPSVRADPGRIEQALLNLAVNARDAMPGGGTLSISTSVVELDEVYSRQHVGAKPGRYVMLAVSDSGCGMDPETRTRVFEPFFTTKEVGKGTGLGLSMVYGIVKQSGGYIWVYSELGLGTTFKIYLPATEAPAESLQPRVAASAPTGTETILLVEDEDGVRELLEEILTAQGYHVLAASRGVEALQISELLDEDIQVLVTDVVMPHMSGHELAMRLRARRPGLRVLYLSGYTDEAIAHHGDIEVDADFLQKPFTRAALATKVRDVLAPRER
jgi:PAS domain S-box-containing protein